MLYRGTFTTPYEQHRDREGQPFALVRGITEAESDYDSEVLPMFVIRFPDGVEISAWPEEVLAEPICDWCFLAGCITEAEQEYEGENACTDCYAMLA